MAGEVDVRGRGDRQILGEPLEHTEDRGLGPADNAARRLKDRRHHADASGCTPRVAAATPGDAGSCASSGGRRGRGKSKVTPATTIAAHSSRPTLEGPRTKLSCGAGWRGRPREGRQPPPPPTNTPATRAA